MEKLGRQSSGNDILSGASGTPKSLRQGFSSGLLINSPEKAKHLGANEQRVQSISRSQEVLSLHKLCCGWLVGIKSFAAFFCSVQVLVIVACLFSADLSVQDMSISTLKHTLQNISALLEERHLNEILLKSSSNVNNRLSRLAKCAETLAIRIREERNLAALSQEATSEMPESAYLRSLAVYFDADLVYYATSQSEYMHVERVKRGAGGLFSFMLLSLALMDAIAMLTCVVLGRSARVLACNK
eukprot:1602105-Rhodomonas_salina.3